VGNYGGAGLGNYGGVHRHLVFWNLDHGSRSDLSLLRRVIDTHVPREREPLFPSLVSGRLSARVESPNRRSSKNPQPKPGFLERVEGSHVLEGEDCIQLDRATLVAVVETNRGPRVLPTAGSAATIDWPVLATRELPRSGTSEACP